MNRAARVSPSLVVILAIVVVLLAGGAAGARRWMLPKVQVTRMVTGPVVQAFYATGTIVPEREYSVRSNVAGILFLEPAIDKGSRVAKDELIARVVSDDLLQKLKQAEAELKEKTQRADEKTSPVVAEYDSRITAFEAMLEIAKREHARLLKLAESDNAKVVEIERAEDRVKVVWSDLEAQKSQRRAKLLELRKDLEIAQATLDIAKWNIAQQEIRAPVDGVVLDWPMPNRTRLAVNDHILTVADVRPEKLVMRAAVDEEDKNKLHRGQAVRMTLYSFADDKFLGTVKTIYDKADPQRRTFEVDVEIQRAATTMPATAPLYDRFAPGMTGELAFVEQEKASANILPRQALQGKAFYVVRNGKIDRVDADAGIRNVTRVEVLSGLDADALVLVSPIGKLQPGDAVRAQVVDPRATADINKPKDVEIFKGGF
jgi:HlyD family secretion protein